MFVNGGIKAEKSSKGVFKSVIKDVDSYAMNIEDHADFEIIDYFETACDVISQYRNEGKGVLVVCTAGVSRSASIVIAYLMKNEGMSMDNAFKLVKEKRRFIKPNNGFIEQLK